ncbi:DNA adenine methylase [Bergeyella cardium]|uniref:DNA adenine methylase n=1 Tax=Bergeyella cardium TaxID=1585976 RepID=A0A6P1QUU4_9FLAO|nr:DNA adenine methylase [Bergeyella cardium]QHN64833.1 DNA adenine methylase [Bergeyella cardium]WHE34140.1 DNA adenine methylase [Bergeyella cardium]WHF60791.1 DNA adenine methylase [Bergeyella cardium]
MKTQLKTPISYYGGKQSMLNAIFPMIPEHTVYCEPFFGGGAVFWSKEPKKLEYINDFNGMVVNFYEQLKSNFSELKRILDATLFSRSTYKQAMVVYEHPYLFTPVVKAWAFWVGTNFGFSNQIGTLSTSPKRISSCINKKIAFSESLSERLKNVFIENIDAVKLIERIDAPEVFFYIDPPYVGAVQGHYGGYTQEHFDKLLECLSKVKGKFMLSSYPNKALSKYAESCGWTIHSKNLTLVASRNSSKKKTECLTINYNLNNL